MKIMIVDDDATCSHIYKLALSKYGNCTIATTGFEALELYKKSRLSNEPFDLIVLDIMMPDINGYDDLKAIRFFEKTLNIDINNQVKVILTTALDDEENQKIAHQLNPQTEAYIAKSVSPDLLVEKIKGFGLLPA